MRFDDQLHFISLFSNTKQVPLKLPLPDTLVIRDGSLLSWFFQSKDGQVLRKSAAKSTGGAIRERFLDTSSRERTGDSSYVAILRDGSRTVLLTDQELLAVLSRLADGDQTLSCVLQVYVRPAGAMRYISTYVRTSRESGVDTFARKYDERYRPASLGGPEEVVSSRLAEEDRSPAVPGLLSLELNKLTMGLVQYVKKAHALISFYPAPPPPGLLASYTPRCALTCTPHELDGLVCEYVQHHSGRVFLIDVLNVSWAPGGDAASSSGGLRPASRASAGGTSSRGISPRPPSAGPSSAAARPFSAGLRGLVRRPLLLLRGRRRAATGAAGPAAAPALRGDDDAAVVLDDAAEPAAGPSASTSPPPPPPGAPPGGVPHDCRPPIMVEFGSELERIKSQTDEYRRKVALLHSETLGMDTQVLALHHELAEKEAARRREKEALTQDLHEITSAFTRQVGRYQEENAELKSAVEAAERREQETIRELRRAEAALAEREAAVAQERAAFQRQHAEQERALAEIQQKLEEERGRRGTLETNLENLANKLGALLREKEELLQGVAEKRAQVEELERALENVTDWKRLGRLREAFAKMAEVAEEESKRVQMIDHVLRETKEGMSKAKGRRAAAAAAAAAAALGSH
eukprot:tig00021178_g19201.t1